MWMIRRSSAARPIVEPRPGADHVLSPVLAELGTGPIVRKKPEYLAVETRQKTALGPGQPGRVLDESLEHRLEIERGAADHLEHFAGGRLLLQRHPSSPLRAPSSVKRRTFSMAMTA